MSLDPCPRCQLKSFEILRSHSYCVNCNYSPDLVRFNPTRRKIHHRLGAAAISTFLFPIFAYADFQSSIQSLVTGVVGGILPAIVMYEAGLAGLSFAKKTPDAKDKAEATAIGAVAVLGINGVWSFLKGHIH